MGHIYTFLGVLQTRNRHCETTTSLGKLGRLVSVFSLQHQNTETKNKREFSLNRVSIALDLRSHTLPAACCKRPFALPGIRLGKARQTPDQCLWNMITELKQHPHS